MMNRETQKGEGPEMSTTKYTEDHEWIRIEDGGVGVVGITDHAQEQLGELVYVELPEVGSEVAKGDSVVVIESVKAASEVHSPAGGTVVEVNEALNDEPTKVNGDPMGEGWFLKLKVSDAAELDGLMDEATYKDGLD